MIPFHKDEEDFHVSASGSNNSWDEKRKGGLRKIADVASPCLSPEHDPPGNIVLRPGEYEYTCPACGKTVRFTVPMIIC